MISLVILCGSTLAPSPSGAVAGTKRVYVRMDTSAWVHYRGWLAFQVKTRTSDCEAVAVGRQTTIRFLDIAHDGSMGPLSTSGCSGMTGSLIVDPRDPATWSVPRTGEQEFAINFADPELKPDEAWVGSSVRFTVELPTSDLDPKEEVVFAFRNREYEPGFKTTDPSGSNVLARFTADPPRRTWRIVAFEPARRRPPRKGATADTIDIVFPRPSRSAGPPVKPGRVLPRIVRANRDLEGRMWIEYSVPAPGGMVRVWVFDRKETERFRHESLVTSPGVYGVEWPESRRDPPPPPGHYRIVVEIAGHRLEAECDL